jgi:hypothetical protein
MSYLSKNRRYMEKCFVIQPFDNGTFDRRYADVFEPAIKEAGLDPYRIDRDLGVRIPIDDIEKGIRDSTICFAEITTDNPNVWYELGFAFACGKDVVMVCSDRAGNKFPFDIQHRQIIEYETRSISDFDELKEQITGRIIALQQTTQTVQRLNATPVVDTEGLKSHEVAVLILVTNYTIANENGISAWYLNEEMNKSGYTEIATNLGTRTLAKSGMIEKGKGTDYNNNEYIAYKSTEKGENWLLNNQELLQFRKPKPASGTSDDLPF